MKLAWFFVPLVPMLLAQVADAADTQRELLVFGSAELVQTSGVPVSATDLETAKIAADVLFSLQHRSFKVFGEYLLTNHESDLERFQVGWEPSDRNVIWLGRFHQASSVWNHEHHHGQFLQTSITRPASEEWEDEGGIIPQHFTGALWESGWDVSGGHGVRTALGGGIAPVITSQGLEPFDFLRPDLSRHKLGVQARIAYLPRELEDTGAGLLYARNEIAWRGSTPSPVGAFARIDQTIIGAYGKYESHDWKLQAAAYRVTTSFDAAASGAQAGARRGPVRAPRGHHSCGAGHVSAPVPRVREQALHAGHPLAVRPCACAEFRDIRLRLGRPGLPRVPPAVERRPPVRSARLALLLLLLAAADMLHAAEKQVVLVVSADSPVLQLEPLEVQKLFLGLPVLRDNRPLHPLRNLSDEQLDNVFLQYVVAMSQSAYDRRILTQVLQQGRPRPLELKSDAEVVRALAADRFAVSYMWLKDVPVNPRMRILRVLWTE
jgi:hypothetical protein